MATKLGGIQSKSVTRETKATYQGRPIIVRLEAGGRLIRVKQKGQRKWHTATVEQLFFAAAKNTAVEIKRLKDEAKKERKKQRAGARA